MASAVQGITDSIASSNVLLNHPGSTSVASDLYPQARSITNEIGKRANFYGRLNIAANALNGGATVTFQIPPSSLVGACVLNASVAVNSNVFASSSWLYELIDSVSYSMGGSSSVNQIQISGRSNFDLVMAACNSEGKRNSLMRVTNIIGGTAGTYKASALIWLPWSNIDQSGSFPYDTATVKSNIQITIQIKPFYNVFNFNTNNPGTVIPTSFSSLNLKCFQTDILNPQLSLGYQMSVNPNESYKFPFHLTQSYVTQTPITTGTPFSISLSSLPAGILEAILVSIVPVNAIGNSTGSNGIIYASHLLTQYSLQHNGQTLIAVDSVEELDLYSSIIMNDGDNLRYTNFHMTAPNTPATATFNSFIYVLPMARDIQRSLDDNWHENLPSYGGSILTFNGTMSTKDPQGNAASSGINYVFNFTYLFSALLDNERFTTSIVTQ